MRKAERIIRDKNTRIPDRYKKIDTTVNGDAERLAEMHKEVEKRLYPLRIDHRTIIYVTKDKCTPEYAAKKREKLGLAPVIEVKGHAPKMVDTDRLQRMLDDGMNPKDIAYDMGVAASTIYTYIRKYGLKNK